MSLALLRPRVKRQVRDGAERLADPEDYDEALGVAVDRYSAHTPRRIVADIVATAEFEYALPEDWEAGWSAVLSVEYPAGERKPKWLDRRKWSVYEGPDGPVLRIGEDVTLEAGATIRVTFTARHTITEDATTVPAADHTAVVFLGAANACEQLASEFSSSGDSTIDADSVDHKSKAAEYASRAKRFEKLGMDQLPKASAGDRGDARAAAAEHSQASEFDHLTH